MTEAVATLPGPARVAPMRTMPVFACTVRLNTDFAQRVFKRVWDRLKGDLYVLTVRTRSSGMDEAANAIETIISEAFASARKDLDSDLERTDTLMDSVKLSEVPEYEGALEVKAKYSTPRAKEFLDLLLKMDQLLMRYDALWLAGHIETQPRVARSQNWQRRLIKLCNRMREQSNRARTGLTREAERHVAKAVGTPAAATQGTSESAAPGEDAEVEREMQALASEESLDGAAVHTDADPADPESVRDPVVEPVGSEDATGDDSVTTPAERPRRRRAAVAAGG